MKVFKMNDCDWVASKSMEEAIAWYKKETGVEDDELDVRECDLDNEGMWIETNSKEDLKELGESDEISSCEKVDGKIIPKTKFGDLKRYDGLVWKFVSFKESIKKDIEDGYGEFDNYIISSTEY